MTSAPSVLEIRALPGTDTYRNLLAQVAEGARDRDLDDENPFDQVRLLKEAGFGRLRIPTELGGAGLSVRQLFPPSSMSPADPIVAHIFRTHFWFVEERLRTSPTRVGGLAYQGERGQSIRERVQRKAPWPWAAWYSTRGCCRWATRIG